MVTTGAVAIALALAAGAADGRLLLCRPRIAGDPALARGEAVAQAARTFGGRFLDYGVVCEDDGEGARAARRAGLAHALTGTAEGRVDGSRYLLSLASAEREVLLAQASVEVAPGADAAAPLRAVLDRLLAAIPPDPEARPAAGPWITVGAGAAAMVAGAVCASVARSSADARDRAGQSGDWTGYVENDARWRSWRTASGVALAAGAAAVAAGLAWRFAF